MEQLRLQVHDLSAQQQQLKAQSWLAAVTVSHCDALLELGAALKQQAQPPGSRGRGGSMLRSGTCSRGSDDTPSADGGGGEGGGDGGAAALAVASDTAVELLMQVRQQTQGQARLELLPRSGSGGGSGGSGTSDGSHVCPAEDWALPGLGWSPAKVAEAKKAGTLDLTTPGFRRCVSEFARFAAATMRCAGLVMICLTSRVAGACVRVCVHTPEPMTEAGPIGAGGMLCARMQVQAGMYACGAHVCRHATTKPPAARPSRSADLDLHACSH